MNDTHHWPSPSLSPLSPCTSASSHGGGGASLTRVVVAVAVVAMVTAVEEVELLLLLHEGAAEGRASPLVSMATGKASTVRGGTVETGELHSVLEPLRRASRCRFLYSSKETWENSGRQGFYYFLKYFQPAGGSRTT